MTSTLRKLGIIALAVAFAGSSTSCAKEDKKPEQTDEKADEKAEGAKGVAEGETAAKAPPAGNQTITIWVKPDKAYKGTAKVGEWFTEETKVKVVVEHPDDASGKFQTAAASGKGPDIIWWAHDRSGDWQAGGLLHPISPKPELKEGLTNMGWNAFSFKENVWGYPLALEAVGLICNKKLVATPPEAFDEFFKLHKTLEGKGKKALLWDYTNTYFTFPLLAAHGGYPFKRLENGSYDEADVGVNNEGALRGLNLLVKLIDKGVMPRGAKYDDMQGAMVKGDLGCAINGNWMWGDLKKNNIEFTVSKLPMVGDKPARSFVGVQGLMISSASKNKQLAVKFIEDYILTPKGLKMLDDDVPLGVPAHEEFYQTLSQDPLIQATMENVKTGLLMPNNPKMGSFWSAMKSALENATNGRQKAKDALDGAAKRIKA